jgi:hypothetical protein
MQHFSRDTSFRRKQRKDGLGSADISHKHHVPVPPFSDFYPMTGKVISNPNDRLSAPDSNPGAEKQRAVDLAGA